MEAPDEPTHFGADTDVERYEQLRGVALRGDPSGCRLGLAVLEHKGVAAWMRLWRSTGPNTDPSTEPRRLNGSRAPVDELVGVLASMALATLGGG